MPPSSGTVSAHREPLRELQDGRLLLHVVGANNVGVSAPKIVVVNFASSSWDSWTYLPLATAGSSFVSPPGASEHAWEIDRQDARGRPPCLLFQIYDHIKGGEAVASASLDFSLLLDPPHTRDLALPIEAGGRRTGGAILVRASFLPFTNPRAPADADPYPSTSADSPYKAALLDRIGQPTASPRGTLRRISAAHEPDPPPPACATLSNACYLPWNSLSCVFRSGPAPESPSPLPRSADPPSPRETTCLRP
eukprot:tig00000498_g1613.t1